MVVAENKSVASEDIAFRKLQIKGGLGRSSAVLVTGITRLYLRGLILTQIISVFSRFSRHSLHLNGDA